MGEPSPLGDDSQAVTDQTGHAAKVLGQNRLLDPFFGMSCVSVCSLFSVVQTLRG